MRDDDDDRKRYRREDHDGKGMIQVSGTSSGRHVVVREEVYHEDRTKLQSGTFQL